MLMMMLNCRCSCLLTLVKIFYVQHDYVTSAAPLMDRTSFHRLAALTLCSAQWCSVMRRPAITSVFRYSFPQKDVFMLLSPTGALSCIMETLISLYSVVSVSNIVRDIPVHVCFLTDLDKCSLFTYLSLVAPGRFAYIIVIVIICGHFYFTCHHCTVVSTPLFLYLPRICSWYLPVGLLWCSYIQSCSFYSVHSHDTFSTTSPINIFI